MLPKSSIADDDDLSAAIRPYQLVAIASPGCPTSDLVGNFGDIDGLFDQLAQPVVIELGKPLPKKRFLPKKRAGSCPATHNRTLLGESDEDRARPSKTRVGSRVRSPNGETGR